MADGTLSLSEVEANLRTLRLSPTPKPAIIPSKRGRKPSKRREVAPKVVELATAELGHDWDRPVPWEPIRDALLVANYSADTIRRALRAAGITLWPRRSYLTACGRQVYPPGLEVPPDPGPDSRRAEQTTVCPEQADVVSKGVDALGDALGIDPTEVAAIVHEVSESVQPSYLPERLAVRIGLVQGLRHSTRETLAGHRCKTVGDALDMGPWLDDVVAADQAARLRRYARGE